MFILVGNRVKSLHRQRVGNVELDVDIGHWRRLIQEEVSSHSVNTE